MIPYIERDYNSYRNELIKLTRKYYPNTFDRLDDASIGQWLIDILSDMGDNLNYHIDRVFQETNIDGARQISSLQNIARTNGLKIQGKKAAICEIELSCKIPLYTQGKISNGDISIADENYCPIIRKGTLFSTGNITFELMNDVDFSEQFNYDGISDRSIIPNHNSNGKITSYTYKKLAIVSAGQSKIYKKIITAKDIKPFFSIVLKDKDILGIESIITKQGISINTDPLIEEFTVDKESYNDKSNKPIMRYFEVKNLLEQYRFGHEIEEVVDGNKKYYNPIWKDIVEDIAIDNNGETINSEIVTRQVMKGKWERLKNKFITEYDDNFNLKITFGSGLRNEYGKIPETSEEFTKYMMSRMEANDYMGTIPDENTTMYILYRVGGGKQSNIAKDTLTNIIYLNMEIYGNCDDEEDSRKKRDVRASLKVTNTTPSYGGKDEPNEEELKYQLKYNNCSQNRCVTLSDYNSLINNIPYKYGCPFRHGVVEENNKIVIYTLGLDHLGKLSPYLAEPVANNIKEYLKKYKMINDFIEIKSGKIINLLFRLSIMIDKTYNRSDIVKKVIDKVYDYMDIRKHQMGEDIFIGDLNKEVSLINGIKNLNFIKCYNLIGDGYSNNKISQELVDINDCCYDDYIESEINFDNQIDLKSSDMILYSEQNSMFEIKNKSKDIIVEVKER